MNTLPTLSQLYTNALNDLESQYSVTISLTKKVALRAFAAMEAGQLWLMYKRIGFLQKNIWVDTADPEALGGTLERFGRIRLGRNPYPAVAGQYYVTITGSIGATIDAQTTFKSSDTSLSPGYLFILDSAYTLVATTDTILLRALTPGTQSKLAIGDTLNSTSPIPLVNNPAVVSSEFVQPLASETIEHYRAETNNSFQIESQGMSAGDIRIWSGDAQGVKSVYPYAKSGDSNSTNVFVEATVADSTDGKGTPSQTILDDVESCVNFKPNTTLPVNETGRRSINAIVYPLPITILDVDIVIAGGTFTPTQQTLLINAITDSVNLIRPFVAAAEPLVSKNDIISTNNLNGVIYSQIPGAAYSGILLSVNGINLLSYTFQLGDIPNVNSITFT